MAGALSDAARLARHRHDLAAHARAHGRAPARAGHPRRARARRDGAVPRHLFVEEALASRAYEDTALPIGFAQTISQPYVVARMIELLLREAKPLGKVLEIGTGCGYQAAVLAQLVRRRSTRSSASRRCTSARARNLLGLRLANLRLVHGDGYAGLEKAAPFQAIIVAAAAPRVPEALLRQLAPGGRMILPLRAAAARRAAARADRAQRPRLRGDRARSGALRADGGGKGMKRGCGDRWRCSLARLRCRSSGPRAGRRPHAARRRAESRPSPRRRAGAARRPSPTATTW